MAEHKKEIYLAKDMRSLKLSADSSPLIQNIRVNPKALLTSGNRLVIEAKNSFSEGDEEQAYILYFRAATLFSHIQKSSEFKKDPHYFQSMMGNNFSESVKKCEILTESLQNRYSLLEEAHFCDAKLKEREIKDALEQEKQKLNKKSINPLHVNGTIKLPSAEDSKSIAPADLKILMDQKATRVLVIDCRGRHDFQSSHLDYPYCISIPQEILTPGLSANRIDQLLKDMPDSFNYWSRRGTFDNIILYDWNSSSINMQESISTLHTAMTVWDRETTYKSQPMILKGGIRNLYYSHPQLMNHPQNTSLSLNKYEETANGSASASELKLLNSISYPELDDDVPKPEQKISANNFTNNLSGSNGLNTKTSANNNSIPPPGKGFDRSMKPKSASTTNVPVPTHGQNGGVSEPKINGIVGGNSFAEISETKAAALNAALDDVLLNSKELKEKELELEKIISSPSGKTANGMDLKLELKLKEKEQEIEKLQSIIKNKDENLKYVKEEYDALVSSRAKPSLPQIRLNQTDSAIENKFKERKELDDYVKLIRSKRKEKERQIPPPTVPSTSSNSSSSRLPTIPGSGSSSPRPLTRTRVGKSESESTAFPTINPSSAPTSGGGSLLRPMSQDATPSSYQKLKDEPSLDSSRSLLKRSHSHPNIAQSLSEDDGEINASPQIPQVNRNLKPLSNRPADIIIPSRARQFHAISSTEKHRTGLKNLGNTCYMNSIVQCLAHLPGLVEYFSGDKWMASSPPKKEIKVPTNGEISAEFQAVLKELSVGHRSIAILDFKNVVGRYHSSFRGYEQQDSHEFLTILVDWLHEELNQVIKTPLKEQNNGGLTDTEAANKAWIDYGGSNRSKIVELFCGQQKSTVRCLSCSKESVTFEPFLNLSVPIPSINNRKVDILQCLDLYTTEEIVQGWSCPHCKSTVKAAKKIDLWRLPPYLIIHLQRFYNDGWWKKRLTEVEFPVDNLDLTPRVKGRPQTQDIRVPRANYMLQAVSNHYGSMDGGHYTAYCRKFGQFAKFDDQEVTAISPRDVVTPAAYILFYCNNSP